MAIWLIPMIIVMAMVVGSILPSIHVSFGRVVRRIGPGAPGFVSLVNAAIVASAGFGLMAFGYFIASSVN